MRNGGEDARVGRQSGRKRDVVEPLWKSGLSGGEKRRRRAEHRLHHHGLNRTLLKEKGRTLLEVLEVGPTTRGAYKEKYAAFQRWADQRGLRMDTLAFLDDTAVAFVDDQFFSGEPREAATYTLASIKHFHKEVYSLAGGTLPRSRAALSGWRRLQPPVTRLPPPKECVALIVKHLYYQGRKNLARMLWLAVECYFRPGEMLSIRRQQIAPPLMTTKHSRFWVVSLHPREEGQPSKTHVFNESVALDLPQHRRLDGMLRLLTKGPPEEELCGVTGNELHRLYTNAASALGLEELEMVPYGARHSGASSDRSSGARSLIEVQQRGRWAALSSVRRYEKAPRILEQLRKLPEDLRRQAIRAEKEMGSILCQ